MNNNELCKAENQLYNNAFCYDNMIPVSLTGGTVDISFITSSSSKTKNPTKYFCKLK